jgi:branched-chain amino acid transport system ATP-binding protein
VTDVLLQVSGVTKRFGGFTALDKVDLVVRPGERLGLIGPNGSGKSTLVNCISGTLRNDEGGIRFEGRDIGKEPAHRRTRLGLARSFQIPKPFASMSVLDNLRIPLVYAARQHEKLSKSQVTDEALHILQQVGLGDKVHVMSGGLTQVDMRKLSGACDGGEAQAADLRRGDGGLGIGSRRHPRTAGLGSKVRPSS